MRWNTFANILANLSIPYFQAGLATQPLTRRRARSAPQKNYFDALESRQLLDATPQISDFTEVIRENSFLTLDLAQFQPHYSDVETTSPTSIRITVPPNHGTLTLTVNGTTSAVTFNQDIPVDQLDGLKYTPTTGFISTNGTNTTFDDIQWNAFDGTQFAISSAHVTLDVRAFGIVGISKNGIVVNHSTSFAASDFTTAYTDIAPLDSITILTLPTPTHGTLTLINGTASTAVTTNQTISADQLDNLVYTPAANFVGSDTFNWSASNGSSSTNTASVSLSVAADLTDITRTTVSNTTLAFSSGDASGAFTQPGPVQTVTIATTPAHGQLKLTTINGTSSSITTVTSSQVLNLSQLDALTYVPSADFAGSDLFTWQVSDGTANSNIATVNLTINSPYIPFSKTIDKGTSAAFTQSDFSNAFNQSLVSIEIIRVPTFGSLTLNNAKVLIGQIIPLNQLGNLVFKVPATFTGSDSIVWEGSATGTTNFVTPASTIALTVNAVDVADISQVVGENVPFDFTSAFFNNNFTGGGSIQTVKIATLPAHGTLTLNGVGIVLNQTLSSGQLSNLVYTPTTNFLGNDSFKWTAADVGVAFATDLAKVNFTVSAFSIAGTSYDTAGVAIINGDATPSVDEMTDFGGTTVNAQGDHTTNALIRVYVITNITDQPLNITGTIQSLGQIANGTNADFQVTSLPSLTTLNPNETTSFTVTFSPTHFGRRTDTVQIPTDIPSGAATTSNFTFAVDGTGLATSLVAGVATNSGLLTATTVAGKGNGAFNGEILHVSYVGKLLDGSIFDQSSFHGNAPFTFRLDNTPSRSIINSSTTNQFVFQGGVIDGWENGLQGAKVGQHLTLIIPAAFGYGGDGNGQPGDAHPSVPGNSTLIFDIVVNAIDGSPSLGITDANNGTAILPGDTTPNVADGTDFGTLASNQTALTNTFTGTNNSPSDTTGKPLGTIHQTGPIKITGANPHDFIVNTSNGSVLGNFAITFKPTAPGVRTATFTVATDDPLHKTFTFALKGNSTAYTDLIVKGVGPAVFPTGTDSSGNLTTTIPVIITNIGNVAVPGTTPTTDIKISIQNTSDTTSASIVIKTITDVHVGGLAVNGSRTINVPVTIPGNLSTTVTYSYVVTVNAGNTVAESLTTNNTFTINENVSGTLVSTTIPSLFVDNASANAPALRVVKGNVVVEVKNSGNIPFASNEKVQITIQAVNGTNSAITIATGSSFSVASLKAGAVKDFTVPVNFAAGLTDGSYTLQAVLSLSPQVYESNITDNTVTTNASSQQLTVVSAPPAVDLTASFGTKPSAIVAGPGGYNITLPVVIKNEGNIAVPHNASSSTNVQVFLLNTDTNVETPIGGRANVNLAGLLPTKSFQTLPITVHVRGDLLQGNYVYEVVINDSTNFSGNAAVIAESDTTNDTATTSTNVTGSLVSSTLPTTVSHSAPHATKGTVTVQLTNAGDLQLPGGFVTEVQLFAHNTNSGVDVPLNPISRTITPRRWQKVGGSFSFTFTVKLPTGLPAGNYTIQAQLVLRPVIRESDIGDNRVTTTFFSAPINLTIT